MMNQFNGIIDGLMVDGFLNLDGYLKMLETYHAIEDAQFGGHTIWPEEDCRKTWNFAAPIYGADGKMTKE